MTLAALLLCWGVSDPQVSVAIETACRAEWPTAECEVVLAVAGMAESGYLPRIGRGECLPGECDSGRAAGWWQVHAETCPPGVPCVDRALWSAARTDPVASARGAAIKLARVWARGPAYAWRAYTGSSRGTVYREKLLRDACKGP